MKMKANECPDPLCNSTDIEEWSRSDDGKELWMEMYCDCGMHWFNVFENEELIKQQIFDD